MLRSRSLFVERPGDFIIAKHLPLEHRRSEAAADGDGDRPGEQVEGRAAHELEELPIRKPDAGSRSLRLLVRSEDDPRSDAYDPAR